MLELEPATRFLFVLLRGTSVIPCPNPLHQSRTCYWQLTWERPPPLSIYWQRKKEHSLLDDLNQRIKFCLDKRNHILQCFSPQSNSKNNIWTDPWELVSLPYSCLFCKAPSRTQFTKNSKPATQLWAIMNVSPQIATALQNLATSTRETA